MTDQTQIKVGDTVNAVVAAWTEDEKPSDKNFFTGKVKSIINRGHGNIYIQIEKLDRNIPLDRVSAA